MGRGLGFAIAQSLFLFHWPPLSQNEVTIRRCRCSYRQLQPQLQH
jgi:hypothetical protein